MNNIEILPNDNILNILIIIYTEIDSSLLCTYPNKPKRHSLILSTIEATGRLPLATVADLGFSFEGCGPKQVIEFWEQIQNLHVGFGGKCKVFM